jgi:hypothetical protein
MFEVKTLVAISFYAGSQTGEPGNEKWASSQGRPFYMPIFTDDYGALVFSVYVEKSLPRSVESLQNNFFV